MDLQELARFTHIMLDLETASNKRDAAILSIGAVEFDILSGEYKSEFYHSIKPMSALHYGGVDGATLQWWMRQSEEARAVWNDPEAVVLKQAVHEFKQWLLEIKEGPIIIWSNGANFDGVVITNAFEAVREQTPWTFRYELCHRTMCFVSNILFGTTFKEEYTDANQIQHNALSDAKFQVDVLSRIFRETTSLAQIAQIVGEQNDNPN